VAAADGRRVVAAGPFDVFLHETHEHPFLNYAIPHDDAEPTADDVATLIAAMHEAHRVPRLEFLPGAAPAAEAALLAGGFAVEGRYPVMVCERDAFTAPAPPEGVTLSAVDATSTRADVAGLVGAQHAAFGEPFTEEDVDGFADATHRMIAVLARAGGVPAGGGVCLRIHDATTELAGIGVVAAYRRRGIAAALTAELVRRAFAAGATTAFLTPGAPETARVYARVGFAPTVEMLHLRAG
jgi:ribosomal protein S18 acetylase RimI-like enzyme